MFKGLYLGIAGFVAAVFVYSVGTQSDVSPDIVFLGMCAIIVATLIGVGISKDNDQ